MSYIPKCRIDEYYNQKYLNKDDAEFIKGFDYAVSDSLECFFNNIEDYDLTVDGEDIDIGRILANHSNLREKFLVTLKEHFEDDRDAMIVSMLDNMDDDEYNRIKESVDKKNEKEV